MVESRPQDFSLIVIGASAGGVEATVELVRRLPSDLQAAVCLVIHFPTSATSQLPQILNRASRLHAQHATQDQVIEAGNIYVAPPDFHLLVGEGRLRLTRGPRYNGTRPAIDPLFRTAAQAYGPRTIGVLLSGTLDDGVAGLEQIQAQGGLTLVQDPNEALFDGLPRAAMQRVSVDQVLPVEQMGAALARMASERATAPAAGKGALSVAEDLEDQDQARVVAADKAALERGGRPSETTLFTCPDCGGVLWELREGDVLHFRCHVGHTYTAEGLRLEQNRVLEEVLWTALRSLEESAALMRRLAHRAETGDRPLSAQQFEMRAAEYGERVGVVRSVLNGLARPPGRSEPEE